MSDHESKEGGQAGLASAAQGTGLVVGIGSSAGGIDALRTFFSKVPADTGMAFVVVQHLDPNYESSLCSIIASRTALPVCLAEDNAAVAAGHVYVIPPDATLTIQGGVLQLARPAAQAARRVSINTFLTSLAMDQGENAVGIILSGFGSDGALGIAAIKEQGGLTLSQAEFDHHAKQGMPQSAASGGFVDHVLAVDDMPQALLDYIRHRAVCDAQKGPDGIRQDLPGRLAEVCAVLRTRLGRDFRDYKTGTLMRRVQRRMHVLQTDTVADYIEQLRSLPHEAEKLFREMLISVTRFFRDREAFQALEAKVIPAILADPAVTDPIRVWVAGCATGEEAYSVAIVFREALTRSRSRRPIQIFATDLDDLAIASARSGLYPASVASDIAPERLAAFFVKEDGRYRVAKAVRDMCLFSTHDLVKDPPFSHIHLVCCRNLLIYFEPQLQQRVIGTFHYALRPDGHLFLGPAESVAAQANLFVPLDKRHRLYNRRDTAAGFLNFSLSHAADVSPKPALRPAGDDIDRRAARAIARYAPAFLVVSRQHDILRFSGQTSKFLQPATGVATLNLFALLHPDLRAAVRAALKEATATAERVLHEKLVVEMGEQYEVINLIVEPITVPGESLFLVAFQEAGSGGKVLPHTPAGTPEEGDAYRALAREAVSLRERLRDTAEGLEAATEELQSSNEEYLSVNEELQSANEELVTSKEELQSLNEELQTINAELNNRNDSLVRSNSDLANLFDSTSIATLFLDRDLRIRRFTPRLLDIFNVREGDEGRPISDIVSNLTRDGLGQDVQHVLRTLVSREREVTAADGMSYLMQVRPYRDLNNVIDGAVINFVDVSERKRHEQARSNLAAIVDSSQDAIIGHDLDGTVTSWNDGASRLLGLVPAEAVGRPMPELVKRALPWSWADMLQSLQGGEPLPAFECTGTNGSGQTIDLLVTISPVREADGRVAGVSLVARDIGARKAAEQKAALLLGELDHRVKNILAIVSAVIAQTLKTTTTPEAFAAEVGGRVRAIAKAHSMLTQSGQGEVSLHAILTTELAPYDRGDGNVAVDGPDVAMTPRAGLALAMAIHELVSNAVKYGALSTVSGRLSVQSEVTPATDGTALALVWAESGGPAVSEPTRRGFGTTLIERSLAHELDAVVIRDFAAGGLHCSVTIPLTGEIGRLIRPGDDGGHT